MHEPDDDEQLSVSRSRDGWQWLGWPWLAAAGGALEVTVYRPLAAVQL